MTFYSYLANMVKLLKIIAFFLLCCVLHAEGSIDCEAGKDSCSDCYFKLVSEITKHDMNMFNLQNGFFPPEKSSPVFITVYYRYGNHSDDCNVADTDSNITEKVWFWSNTIFYMLQPVHVLQYTSLFFADTATFYTSEICLMLDPDCYDAGDEHMKLLTQRVSCPIIIPL